MSCSLRSQISCACNCLCQATCDSTVLTVSCSKDFVDLGLTGKTLDKCVEILGTGRLLRNEVSVIRVRVMVGDVHSCSTAHLQQAGAGQKAGWRCAKRLEVSPLPLGLHLNQSGCAECVRGL